MLHKEHEDKLRLLGDRFFNVVSLGVDELLLIIIIMLSDYLEIFKCPSPRCLFSLFRVDSNILTAQ